MAKFRVFTRDTRGQQPRVPHLVEAHSYREVPNSDCAITFFDNPSGSPSFDRVRTIFQVDSVECYERGVVDSRIRVPGEKL